MGEFTSRRNLSFQVPGGNFGPASTGFAPPQGMFAPFVTPEAEPAPAAPQPEVPSPLPFSFPGGFGEDFDPGAIFGRLRFKRFPFRGAPRLL